MIRFFAAAAICMLAAGALAAVPAEAQTPNNFYGTHLIVGGLNERGRANLSWTRNLVGKNGYVKNFFFGINKDYKGAPQDWQDFVEECYRLELIPVIRLGGFMVDGNWQEPYKDPDGSYRTMANVFKNVVSDLPRSDKYPLYVEIWNEPNLDVEWSGKSDLEEYAQFFVQVSKAIRSLGDSRIKILNGAFALSPSSTEASIKAHPDFIHAFDVWGSHPYPQNHPPEYNVHDGTAKVKDFTIDGYLLETDVLAKYGRKDVKVMILETGYPLGNGLFQNEGYPVIDEYNRADYMMRAFRDYYPQWPELLAVFPFLFSDPGWTAFNWVQVDSGTDAKGWPTKPTPMYTAVASLAKPTDSTGAISGTITDGVYGTRLQGVRISSSQAGYYVTTDPMGNFFFPRLEPGSYELIVEAEGFEGKTQTFTASAGKNTVADFALAASQTGRITGVVLDGMTDQPLAGATVTLSPSDEKATSAADGTFTFTELPPISYDVIASRDGFTTHTLDGLTVPPGGGAEARMKIAVDRKPDQQDLGGNRSFEAVADLSKRPWNALQWEPLHGGQFEATDEQSRSGLRSLRITATGGDSSVRQITHYGTMEPGKKYVCSIWVKTAGLQGGADAGASVTMAFTTNAGHFLNEIPMQQSSFKGDTDWQYVEISGVAPQGAERLSLNLKVEGASGYAYFDDSYQGLAEGETSNRPGN